MPAKPESFRRFLVEHVAFQTPWARRWVQRGRQPGLAESLGISEAILDEAAVLLRAGALPGPKVWIGEQERGPTWFDFQMPRRVFEFYRAIARDLNMTTTQLVRSMMHVVMQTTREPTSRIYRKWDDVTGAAVPPGTVVVPLDKPQGHVHVDVTAALAKAVHARAQAFGVSKCRYVILWCADLVDGKLADLVFEPLELGQLFYNEQMYVLPAVVPDPARDTVLR